jgi:hypothetical protein
MLSLKESAAVTPEAMAGLSPEERAGVLFDLLDVNKDGSISKAEMMNGASQLRMTLFEAAVLFDKLDIDKDGSVARSEFNQLVGVKVRAGAKGVFKTKAPVTEITAKVDPSFALPKALMDFLGVEEDTDKLRRRPMVRASDIIRHSNGSYTVTFRGGKSAVKGKAPIPQLGFKLVEAPRKNLAPLVDLTGYEQVDVPPYRDNQPKVDMKGLPLAGDAVLSVDGYPVELDGVTDAFARVVKLIEDASKSNQNSGCVTITFRTPVSKSQVAAFLLGDGDEEEETEPTAGGTLVDNKKPLGKRPESMLDLRPGLDDEEEEDEEPANIWEQEPGGAPPMEVELDGGSYAVQFSTKELHVKLMENVDRRLLPVVAKSFPGATLLQRGHLLMSVNGKAIDDMRSQTHEPYATALDLLRAMASPPVTLEFTRPPPVAKITVVEGQPGLYDAIFEGSSFSFLFFFFLSGIRTYRYILSANFASPSFFLFTISLSLSLPHFKKN